MRQSPDPPGHPSQDEIAAFCHGEHAALVGLLALYTGDRGVAEELAQEALIRACEHWPRVRSMDNRRAWLTRVAVNLANSWFRRRFAERRAHARHGGAEQGQGHGLGRDAADVIAVRQAVAALPRRQRTALVLRYYADLPAAQVAAQMGCAEATVRSLTNRAIETLRARGGLVDTQELTP